MKCANCGKKIPDATYMNIDGEQCCQNCYQLEEEHLQYQEIRKL